MSIAGYPMDPGERGRQDDGRATPAGEPPSDWDARFTAIVSGISASMRWGATARELDAHAAEEGGDASAEAGSAGVPAIPRAPEGTWLSGAPDTADDRRARREMRRAERAAELEAFRQAQAEVEAARAADTEHYVPPPPPPLPTFRRRTVGALLLMALGIVLIVFPWLMPAPFELIAVVGLLCVLGGAAVLVGGMRRNRGDSSDGAQV